MKSINFTKMHALGNNYIYINQFKENLCDDVLSDLSIKVSNVNTGIGSDGMILICPSEVAPVKMRIFNKDGSEGKNCGNGLRCVAKYSFEKGLVNETSFLIETLSGIVEANVKVENEIVTEVIIDMDEPKLLKMDIPMAGEGNSTTIAENFSINGETYVITSISMGNPHAVIFVDDINEAPITTLGQQIAKDSRFPEGVNVEFIEMLSQHEINFRVWERGSGVTLACGTGACAAVVAAILNKKAAKGEEIVVHLAGGDLTIKWDHNNKVYMTGSANYICDGVFYYED